SRRAFVPNHYARPRLELVLERSRAPSSRVLGDMLKRGRVAPVSGDTEGDNSDARPPLRRFEDVYDEHVDFVRRSARWFGVLDAAAEDIVQQVFMVVHRRLPDLRRGSSPRTWLFGIVMRVVLQHRRSLRRKNPDGAGPHIDPETVADDESNGPD